MFFRRHLAAFLVGLSVIGFIGRGAAAQAPPAETPPADPQPVAAQPAPPADAAGGAGTARDSDQSPVPAMLLDEFRPRPQLKVRRTEIDGARFPVVDVHTHMLFRQHHNEQALDDFVEMMNRNSIAVCVSLDAELSEGLEEHMAFLWNEYRDRFVIFVHLDFIGHGRADEPATWASNQPGWAERCAVQLAEAKRMGISGLKIFKRLGLEHRDAEGNLLAVDDPKLDPIWRACGDLGLPVLIHTADPSAFFEPLGPENERWEELSRHPDWHYYGKGFPSRRELLEARNRVLRRHPKTHFIGAHMASSSEDLAQLAEWLDTYPNLWVDPASRISELGRQPYTAREFLIRYADRVLFGTDGPWPEARLEAYWRFFQTKDEYFPYSEKEYPPQGAWRIYGIDLPDEALRKIYYLNASHLIPGVEERLRKFQER